MKILTGLQRALYNAIKNGSPAGNLVVRKARHPMHIARALEKKGYIEISRWDGRIYLARITGKDPDILPKTPKKSTCRRSLPPSSPRFPPRIIADYPDAVKYRQYADGLKTVEIPINIKLNKSG